MGSNSIPTIPSESVNNEGNMFKLKTRVRSNSDSKSDQVNRSFSKT